MHPHPCAPTHGIRSPWDHLRWYIKRLGERWRTALESNLITLVDTQHDNIQRGTPQYEHLAVIGRQWNVLAKPDRKIGLSWGCESIKHRRKAGGERTFDVKCRPKAISSPCSSACLIVLSRANPLAAIHSLPAQKARRKLFDSQSTTRSSKPWTHGSTTCKYTKFNNVRTDTTSVGGKGVTMS